MGSQPPCDRPAIACAAERTASLVPVPGLGAAAARWSHESVDVSSAFLIVSVRDSTVAAFGSERGPGMIPSFGGRVQLIAIAILITQGYRQQGVLSGGKVRRHHCRYPAEIRRDPPRVRLRPGSLRKRGPSPIFRRWLN